MSVQIERIQCGNGNCFLVTQGDSAILVDTSRSRYRDHILDACKGKRVRLIVLTHGHVDHIQNAAFLSERLGAPIAMSEADVELIADNLAQPMMAHSLPGKLILALSMASFKHDVVEPFVPAERLRDGDSLKGYGVDATVVALPGHTKGSIGILADSELMVGDALMNMAYPSKSLLYGDRAIMEQTASRIGAMQLSAIHFGHGKSCANREW